jgi:hypothetical protein
MRTIAAITFCLFLSGCSTAGPYVTNISSDGGGGLTVEKCMAHMNAFLGVISNSECTTTNIKLSDTSRR